MARRPREDAPGVAHHVMLRGIERRLIFVDDADREDFLRRLDRLVAELGFACFAWALMPNHVHLVVRSGAVRISRLMARLGTGYARRFNERHARVGHLFQNRFRSRCVVDDADLLGLVLYVVRNPLEAGLVADALELEDFPWCGLGALLGRRTPRSFEAVSETLALFGPDRERARRELRAHLGAPQPVLAMPVEDPRGVRAQPRPSPSGFESLTHDVCSRFGVSEAQIRSSARTRRLAAARSAIAVRAASELGLSGAEVARRLGVTKSAVSAMLRARRPASETS
jgi:REP element-mobilizing transposase RayT